VPGPAAFERLEEHVRGAVPPALLERKGQAAVRQLAQAVVRDGRPGQVLDQALEAVAKRAR